MPDYSTMSPAIRTRSFTLGLADVAVAIITPKWCRRLSIRFATAADVGLAGKYSSEGTEGAAIDSSYQIVALGALHTFNLNRSGLEAQDQSQTILVASATASAVVRVTFESGAV